MSSLAPKLLEISLTVCKNYFHKSVFIFHTKSFTVFGSSPWAVNTPSNYLFICCRFTEVWLITQYCISFRCTTYGFHICIHCERITIVKWPPPVATESCDTVSRAPHAGRCTTPVPCYLTQVLAGSLYPPLTAPICSALIPALWQPPDSSLYLRVCFCCLFILWFRTHMNPMPFVFLWGISLDVTPLILERWKHMDGILLSRYSPRRLRCRVCMRHIFSVPRLQLMSLSPHHLNAYLSN